MTKQTLHSILQSIGKAYVELGKAATFLDYIEKQEENPNRFNKAAQIKKIKKRIKVATLKIDMLQDKYDELEKEVKLMEYSINLTSKEVKLMESYGN